MHEVPSFMTVQKQDDDMVCMSEEARQTSLKPMNAAKCASPPQPAYKYFSTQSCTLLLHLTQLFPKIQDDQDMDQWLSKRFLKDDHVCYVPSSKTSEQLKDVRRCFNLHINTSRLNPLFIFFISHEPSSGSKNGQECLA